MVEVREESVGVRVAWQTRDTKEEEEQKEKKIETIYNFLSLENEEHPI